MKYKKILISSMGILFIGAGLLYFNFSRQTELNVVQETKKQDEVQKIKDENAEAVASAGKTAIRPVRAIDKSDHYIGLLDAPVQLIIYENFECTFCLKYSDTIAEVKKNYSDKILIAYRHFPLSSHPLSIPAAIASECADEQGKFWEMYDKLFALNKDGNLNPEGFKQVAIDLKLDAVKFNQCYETEKYKDKILEQMVEARNFGVTGVPASFLNGQPLPGAVPFEDYKSSDGREMEGMKTLIEETIM